MKIAYSKTNCFDANFETVNKKISVNVKSSNGPELALELEERGYDWVIKEFEDSQK